MGAPGSAAGFASVRDDGLFFTDFAKNVTAANLSHTAGSDVYCFSGMPFTPRSAVAVSNGLSDLDVVVNVNIRYAGADCPGRLTVPRPESLRSTPRTGAVADRGFTIGFEN